MVMSAPSGWRCVIVPPPDPHAAVGGALRHAFRMDGQNSSLTGFETLLNQLRAIH